ncbi:mechanosensitive ion channel family protein [Burkholderia sp. PAMC 26561]|jgi:small conductance mechanosensitive channel|uniref:mechanosensitive ion channel family protein n=1 Tax=Burkholderia sp. PAMC 26561 TaxID=1795043 RepID=UPI00076B2058|nr:mechanosensitive ion channel domain-containing protein [Burkholderia sp. PAMC 26561]AME23502.1 mechanosensitive ion channel protein MscS [Burkholderia sp. PAMC 26561]
MDPLDKLRPVYNFLMTAGVSYGIDVLVAILILIVGWWISNRVAAAVKRALGRTNADATFTPVMASLVQWAIRVIAIVAALGKFGVAAASILTVLGAAGLAIGLALQGTLQNIAAGLMLLLLRPFKVGDYIEGVGATAGTVNEIGLFTTRLTKSDGVIMFVPNSTIWANPVTNFTANDRRRVVLNVIIPEDQNIEKTLASLHRIVETDPRIINDEKTKPWIAVSEYTDTGPKLNIGVWTNRTDYANVQADLLRQIKPGIKPAETPVPPPGSAPA